jgi:iron-sulfur cluster assembly protein
MITATQKAQQHMKGMLDLRGKGEGIRLGVKTTGCSGYAYVIEYADTINDNDTIIELDSLNIIIDNKSELFLRGSEIDFVEDKLGKGLKFNNPNTKALCGCGESFTI